jgi:hypothetical protein
MIANLDSTLRPDRRAFLVGAAHVVLSTALLLLAYFLLPLDGLRDVPPLVSVPVALVLFFGLTAYEIRGILRATYPGIRALEALGVLVPVFLLMFSAIYYVMELRQPSAFGAKLTRVDALYFTMTVFATVGFGDISAKTQNARIVVTIQMFTDLIVLGAGLKVIMGAVQRRRDRRPTS